MGSLLAVSQNMYFLVKQSTKKLTSPQVAFPTSKTEASFCKVPLIYSTNNYPKFS